MRVLPLTSIQRAYLMGRDDMFENNGISTHVYYEIVTKLSPEKFGKSFNKIIKKQSMFRAVFDKNKACQSILDEVPYYEIVVDDWEGKSETEIVELTKEKRERMSHTVFDVENWPLFEINYSKISKDEFCAFISFDLLIADGKSLADLAGLIMDDNEGVDILSSKSMEFEDFIYAKEEEKKNKRYEVSQNYWGEMLNDIADAPNIIDFDAASNGNLHFRRLEYFVDKNHWSQIKNKLNEHKISPSMGALAAYCAVMGYWANQEKFTINSPIMSFFKRKKEYAEVLGDFTEVLLVPAEKYNMNEEFISYMKRISNSFVNSYKHNAFDGIDVMNLLRNNRSERVVMPVVFTSMLVKEKSFSNMERFGKVQYGVSQTPQVYLDCQLMEREERLSITWDYVDKLFDEKKISRMFSQFVDIIKRLNSDDIIVNDILSVDDEEKQKLIAYNSTYVERNKMNIGELLGKSFTDFRDKIAVSDEEKRLTYGELDKLSTRVAAMMKENGIGNQQRVGIVCDRTVETIVNIIAVIKIGATYVPIEPHYPDKRKEYIYINSNCVFLLDKGSIDKTTTDAFTVAEYANTDDDAYVIYTSGSTGTPKGVVISNDAVCNTVENINSKFGVQQTDTLLGISSFGFDLSVYDVLGALACGAELRICENPKDIRSIRKCMDNGKITVWNSVPAIMELLLNSLNDGYVNTDLRLVLLSGDWIPLDQPKHILKHFPNALVVSLGGATEGSIWSIYYPIVDSMDDFRSVPYGYPMENQQMYILDNNLQQVPYGVEGEIYIGGRGVAKCYENDEERTNLAYLNHPLLGRIYKTGDFGVMNPAGYMEFRGRKDTQVKIRGYRIELAEIERAVAGIENISNAVTDVYINSSGAKSLVTYIVSDPVAREEETGFDFEEMASSICEEEDAKTDFSYISQYNSALEKAATEGIKVTLSKLVDWAEVKTPISAQTIIEKNGLKKEFIKLLTEWMQELAADGYLVETESGFVLSEAARGSDIVDYWSSSILQDSEGAVKILTDFVKDSCSKHIELLKGEITELSLFFPNGESHIAQSMYKKNPIAKYVNSITQEIFLKYLEKIAKGETLKILELGAGIGGTTSELFEVLARQNVEYTFTDVTDLFVHEAQKLYGQYECMKFGVLDINDDFQIQGYDYANYDVIIAANVLHDAINLNKTIQYISNCLKPTGVLFLVETTKNLRAQMTSVGFIEGFLDYEDERLNTNRPLLELSEWEQVLTKNGMKDVEVYPSSNSAKQNMWQSLIIAKNGDNRYSITQEEIRRRLGALLPDYMIPNRVIRVSNIPLTENGKVNKKALPKIDVMKIHQIYCPPQNEIETILCNIWCEVLNVPRVGIHDNFFELGGDSLKAINIVAKIEENGLSVKLADIFSCQDIAELSKIVEVKDDDIDDSFQEISLSDDELDIINQMNF